MAYETFKAKAPVLMARLMEEFKCSVEDAAAIAGNAGHESGGLVKLQEIAPVVKDSKGGYGWFQWTGPRRRAFEAWCSINSLKPSSDAANIGFLIYELNGPESKAIPKTKAAVGLKAKVIAFEMAYERAGVKHYDSRLKYAQMALEVFGKATAPVPPPPDIEPPVVPDKPRGLLAALLDLLRLIFKRK